MENGGTHEDAKARREGSLDALSKIYYIVGGLAVTEAIKRAVGEVPKDLAATEVHHLFVLVLFLSIAVRFIHGAATHFSTHKHSSRPLTRYQRWQPLLDFLLFGGQA